MISTVISFSSLETRFFDALIHEVEKFSDNIIVVAYDHFFDGTKERMSMLLDVVKRYSNLVWTICAWNPNQDSKYWHNNARWVGAEQAKHKRVLFLDADEIPDGDLMRRFLEGTPLDDHALHTFSCYWYFRDPRFQATTKECCGLLADMSQVTKEMFFTRHERWFYQDYPIKTKTYCDLIGNVIFNHYSWVRTKEEMLTKVKSWAHRHDCNWTTLVKQEFTQEFTGKDFVHGYSYNTVLNIFNLQRSIIHNAGKLNKPILEIGVGYGFYGRTLTSIFPHAEIYGIEIWPAYLSPKHLEWYKAVIVANALHFNYSFFKDRLSLIIAADVVEHFTKEDAIYLVETWKRFAPWIIITMPIQDFEQGAYLGNEFESHLHQWKVAEVERDLGMKLVKDCGVCGLFEYNFI